MAGKYSSRQKQKVIDEVLKLFRVIIPSNEISVCRDPDDDLLSLGNVGDVTIVHQRNS